MQIIKTTSEQSVVGHRLLQPGAIGQKYASQWGEIFFHDEEAEQRE